MSVLITEHFAHPMTDTSAQNHYRGNGDNCYQLDLGITVDVKADLGRGGGVILINAHIPRDVVSDCRLFQAGYSFVKLFLKTKIQGDPPLTFLLVWEVSP